jgi:hypothetical protein
MAELDAREIRRTAVRTAVLANRNSLYSLSRGLQAYGAELGDMILEPGEQIPA